MKIEVITTPEKKEKEEITLKIKEIVKDRNAVIAKRFGETPRDITVNLMANVDALRGKIRARGDESLGVYSGYVDYSDDIEIAHPVAIETIFADNLYKQISIMVDYTLIKLYLCKKYYPTSDKFKLYHLYLTDIVARITSGNFQKNSIDFMIRQYEGFKKYKKDEELKMVLLVMLEKSGLDFIYDNLDTFYADLNIKKSLMNIYKKDMTEFLDIYKKELIEIHKKLMAANGWRRKPSK